MKPYKARTITGAQARVRQLMKLVDEQATLLLKFSNQKKLLARLAADTPQFYNPLEVMEAKQLRDSLLP